MNLNSLSTFVSNKFHCIIFWKCMLYVISFRKALVSNLEKYAPGITISLRFLPDRFSFRHSPPNLSLT
jgi:hypothetical protein